jgi:hypothetical protein
MLTTAGSTAFTASVIEFILLAEDALLGCEVPCVTKVSVSGVLFPYLLIKAIEIKALSNKIRIIVKRLICFKFSLLYEINF